MSAPLSKRGAALLAEAEEKIERGLATFDEVGKALFEIRDGRLYREEYETFEDYCLGRWHFTSRRARQLMEAADIGTIVPVTNEGQARALSGLAPDEAIEVYEAAEAAGDVTAKSLAVARAAKHPKPNKVVGGASPAEDAPPPALTPEGGAALPADDGSSGSGPSPAPESAPPSVLDPALKMHARLSDFRKHLGDWIAYDRHHEVIDAMTPEQRADYRSHVHSVWQHASETLDYLDNPARLKAVQ